MGQDDVDAVVIVEDELAKVKVLKPLPVEVAGVPVSVDCPLDRVDVGAITGLLNVAELDPESPPADTRADEEAWLPTGQIVVYNAIVSVTTTVDPAGQFVTVFGHCVTV